MAIKSFKPYSAGRRFMTVSTFDEITASKPEKSLLVKVTSKGGRNNQGRMTVRHQGGGHKRRFQTYQRQYPGKSSNDRIRSEPLC